MRLLQQCILCGSHNFKPYSMRFKAGFPHISRVKCNDCNIVFANPIADQYGQTYNTVVKIKNKYFWKQNRP